MLKIFAKKKENPQEGPVLWKSGSGTKKVHVQEERPLTLFGIPVSPEALAGKGKIIAVQCAKHGDGASTVAANLAGYLALSSPERVVLVDLDGYGSVRSRLGLPVDQCLVNILDWEDVSTARENAGRMQEHSSGIMVIPGVVHLDHVPKVKPTLVFKLLTILKEHYDYIILDCPPVGSGNTWAAALVSDAILTVISPDRASLDMLSENNAYMTRLGCKERVITVLNKAGMPGGIRPADLLDNEKLGLNISAVLPHSVEVTVANNRRELIVQSRRRDDFSQAVQKLAEILKDREGEDGNQGAKSD